MNIFTTEQKRLVSCLEKGKLKLLNKMKKLCFI